MGFNATWSMAVGGMVGGGLFSVLGVVMATAGAWSWLSFVLAGLIALCAAHSYQALGERFGEGGGAFTFLRKINQRGLAGSISWVVIGCYALTVSVYGFTFSHYLANLFEFGEWFPRAISVALIGLMVGVNLRGVGNASAVEVVAVWGKLFVLVGLGVVGLSRWAPGKLVSAGLGAGPTDAIVGAAIAFMAYEGFQLLAYDYDEVEDPSTTVPRAMTASIGTVIVVYILVAFGAAMLVGADGLIGHAEVALAFAGQEAAGEAGLWAVTVAAAAATTSAVNATLFAVSRLVEQVAEDGELPRFLAHRTDEGIPDRAIIAVGVGAAFLAVFGSLSQLVEAASLGFLATFMAINVLALLETKSKRWVSFLGALGGAGAGVILLIREATENPATLVAFGVFVFIAIAVRPVLLKLAENRGG